MTMNPWPPPPSKPWPQSLSGSTGTGQTPDFPSSAGDRELGKFRTSKYPRLVQVAVVDDDGNPI